MFSLQYLYYMIKIYQFIFTRDEMSKDEKSIEIELTRRNDKLLKRTSKKCGLKPDEILTLLLECEINVACYAMSKRLKVFRRLKIEPTAEQLLGFKLRT